MTQSVASSPRRPIRARRPRFAFETVPRYWLLGSPLATSIGNSLNLLFPDGEKFFIRSVQAYLREVEDPELRRLAMGFFAQEGMHHREHERFFTALRAQGYDIDTFLKVYRFLAYGVLERLTSPKVRLAGTAALEHFTATIAEGVFRYGLLEGAHPVMQEFLRWHAAEEIEHKCVAYDVLQSVDDSHAVRMAGLVIGSSCLAVFGVAGALMLLAQERGVPFRQHVEHWRMRHAKLPTPGWWFVRAFRNYTRRDFHPAQNDNFDIARRYFEEHVYPQN